MGQPSLISAAERARADAAIARLRAQPKVGNVYAQVTRGPAQEDGTFFVSVHVHVGPLGNGRTIIVEKTVGNILARKMVGDEAYAQTQDWREIDLSRIA